MSPENEIGVEKNLKNTSANLGIAAVGEVFFSLDSWIAGFEMLGAVGRLGSSLVSAVEGTLTIASMCSDTAAEVGVGSPVAVSVQPSVNPAGGKI